jgi:L-seryl-tRNA(Ser) seleniumtransferase
MGGPPDVNQLLRQLPKVDDVLREDPARRLLGRAPRWAVVDAIRVEIEALRARLLAGPGGGGDVIAIDSASLERRVDSMLRPSLRPVLNATGVVLHTNLGRAPLAERAIDRMVAVARGYSNLEYRLDAGDRGSRHDHVAGILAELCGAEAALVVNNGAAAVMLALAALAAGREVIVSRGELVEIGGSFRIPDVLRASGARLVEVGTTNRTHLRDYERAISADTAMLLKVHRSNFAVVGFTTEVPVAELSRLSAARGLLTAVDLGSGSLHPTQALGLPAEPTAQQVVQEGADLVTFSGDKLLGGPQAGLLLARKRLLDPLRTHPLLRALRPDKLTIAALEATLELYRDGRAAEEVPSVALLATSAERLAARAEALRERIARTAPGVHVSVVEARGAVGGGALPLAEPPSVAVAVLHPRLGADALDAHLRAADPPVVARIDDGRLLLDVRTLFDRDLDAAAAAFRGLGPASGS